MPIGSVGPLGFLSTAIIVLADYKGDSALRLYENMRIQVHSLSRHSFKEILVINTSYCFAPFSVILLTTCLRILSSIFISRETCFSRLCVCLFVYENTSGGYLSIVSSPQCPFISRLRALCKPFAFQLIKT